MDDKSKVLYRELCEKFLLKCRLLEAIKGKIKAKTAFIVQEGIFTLRCLMY